MGQRFTHGSTGRLEEEASAHGLPIADCRSPCAGTVHYRNCQLCEHRCGVDRTAGERGECKAGPTPRLFRHRIEFGEEAELVPSHLFYLSGCDLHCAFCIAEANAFDPGRGRVLDAETFRAAVAWGQARGAKISSGSAANRRFICRHSSP